MMHVLLLEHDFELARDISRLLTRHGMSIDLVTAGREVESNPRQRDGNTVAMLDVALRDIDGFAVLRAWRDSGCTLPVMLLTNGTSAEQRVRGLEEGADDCLAKPFAAPELVARLRALVRRIQRQPVKLQVGGLHLDVDAKRASVQDQTIELLPREWALLEFLMRHSTHVVSKETIIRVLSSPDAPISRTVVDVNLSRIRRKIAHAGVTIRTLRGQGVVLECRCA